MPLALAEEDKRTAFAWRRWAVAVVPAIALLELLAHVWQTTRVVPEKDWLAARDAVKAMVRPDDLIVFAPRWADPLGRRYFGDGLATLAREAAPDFTRFPRAIEVSIRGGHTEELEGWAKAAEQRAGAITIRTLANPAPVKILDDLVEHATPDRVRVSHVDGAREDECRWGRTFAQTGGLGFGPAVPADRFTCAGGAFLGVSVVAALDYTAHRCLYAPPPSGTNALLRIRFSSVAFGKILHGHHGLYVEAERNKDGAPVTLTLRVGDRLLGQLVHHDGDGWKSFELPTDDLAGQSAELVAEVASPNGHRRMYCFEADTR